MRLKIKNWRKEYVKERKDLIFVKIIEKKIFYVSRGSSISSEDTKFK